MALEFQVPQFTEIEDKVVGSLTIKQFLYLAGGGGAIFIMYGLTGSIILAIILGAPFAAIAAALAFYKYNEQPFIKVMENFIKFNFTDKIYIWKQPKPEKKEAAVVPETKIVPPTQISQSKLKELAWSLDIKEKKDGN
jgi:hypothetical protein